MNAESIEGWTVQWDAPTIEIIDEHGRTVFHTDDWDPKAADPREDALGWASAIANPGSGLTVDHDDDPTFGEQARYVRKHAPALFADECALRSEEAASA